MKHSLFSPVNCPTNTLICSHYLGVLEMSLKNFALLSNYWIVCSSILQKESRGSKQTSHQIQIIEFFTDCGMTTSS